MDVLSSAEDELGHGRHRALATILINNYNYGLYLADAIQSALSQTYPSVEVIVVDDGSTDNSREIINSFKDQVTAVLKENGGQASAINSGFRRSRGEFIFLLDADDTFMPHKVSTVINALESSPHSGWCFHTTNVMNGEGELLMQCGPAVSGEFDFRAQAKSANLQVDLPATSGLVFRRTLFEKMLPMPEASGIEISDAYLKCAALVLAKATALNVPLAVQRVHGANRYTLNFRDKTISSRILIKTAFELREHFPEIRRLANKLVASAIYEGVVQGSTAEERRLWRDYLKSCTRISRGTIILRAGYHLCRWKLRNLRPAPNMSRKVERNP